MVLWRHHSRWSFSRKLLAVLPCAGAARYAWWRVQLEQPAEASSSPSPPVVGRSARVTALRNHASEPYDLVVIGAGGTGLTTALTAARNGLRVLVVDAADVGGGASGSAPGLLLSPQRHLSRAVRAFTSEDLQMAWRQFVEAKRLCVTAPAGVFASDVRMVMPSAVTHDTTELRLTKWASWAMSRLAGLPVAVAAADESSTASAVTLPTVPWMAADVRHHTVEACRVDGARLCTALAKTCERAGVDVVPYCAATDISYEAGEGAKSSAVCVRLEPAGAAPVVVRTRYVANCAGAWVDTLRALGPSADRAVLDPISPARSSEYALRGELQGSDLTGEAALAQGYTGHVYFTVPRRDVKGLGGHNAALVSDHGQGVQVSVSPLAHGMALVGLGTVAAPTLGLRACHAIGLPLVDTDGFGPVYAATRATAASVGIGLPPTFCTSTASLSAALQPFAPVAREVHLCGVGVEACGYGPDCALYNAVGGHWLTARHSAALVVTDVLRRDYRRQHPLLSERAARYRFSWRQAAMPSDYVRLAALDCPDVGAADSVNPDAIAEAAHMDLATTLVDVIARRTSLATADPEGTLRLLPALAAAMAPVFGWSTRQAADEVRAAREYIRLRSAPPALA